MTTIALQDIERLVEGDLNEKITQKAPDAIPYIELDAMARGSIRRRARLVADPLSFLVNNRDKVSLNNRATIQEQVEFVIATSFQTKLEKIFVEQFADDFDEKFRGFCESVIGYLEQLHEKNGHTSAVLDERFLKVVEAEDLNVNDLSEVVESIRSALAENYLSDEKGALTKAHQSFDKAIRLGLLNTVSYVPFGSAIARNEVGARNPAP